MMQTSLALLSCSLVTIITGNIGVAHAQLLLPLSRASGKLAGSAKRTTTTTNNDPTIALGYASSYAFTVSASIGTPPQNLSLVVSPSYSDSWVPSATFSQCDPFSSEAEEEGEGSVLVQNYCLWGSYNASKSTTREEANQAYEYFSIDYADGGFASGTNMTDDLNLGNVQLQNYPIGVVESTEDQWIGILGLGSNATAVTQYPTLLDRLVDQGQISSPAYSIWLDEADGTTGNLLLGAIDTSRFSGQLISTLAENDYAFEGTFGISVVGVNITDGSSGATPQPLQSNDLPLGVNIDPATALSVLPNVMASKIWAAAGATYNLTVGAATIPCSTTSTAHFSFQLVGSAGPVLDVQMSDLIVSPVVNPETQYLMTLTPSTCLFGIQNNSVQANLENEEDEYTDYYSSSYYTLGSSILRRTYMVFDIPNQQVALAPVVFNDANPGSPTVVAFSSFGATIPSATEYCGDGGCSYTSCLSDYYNDDPYSACYSNYPGSYPSETGFAGSGSGGGDSGSGSDSAPTPPGMPSGESVAIGVGVSFGFVALIGIIAAAVVWRRALRMPATTKDVDAESAGADSTTGAGPEMTSANTPAPVLPPRSDASVAAAAVAATAAATAAAESTLPTVQEEATVPPPEPDMPPPQLPPISHEEPLNVDAPQSSEPAAEPVAEPGTVQEEQLDASQEEELTAAVDKGKGKEPASTEPEP